MTQPDPQVRRPTHIVGIGASAGGLEPLEAFFDEMPGETGLAFVVIQHPSPDYRSLMDELLSRHTRMPIHRAEDGMAVEADALYLIPPKTQLTLKDGHLWITEQVRKHDTPPMPIDAFFKSLAEDFGDKSVAVVLSGTGSDGSRGIAAVREAGGLVVVQDRGSSKFDGMPQAAIETGMVDLVCTAEAMPGHLMDYLADPDGFAESMGQLDEGLSGTSAIFKILNRDYGIDFNLYKPSTVNRRIERRIHMAQYHDVDEYARRLAEDKAELNRLYKDLLIGVTQFFRDAEAFARLEKLVIPGLFENKKEDEEVRAWIVGCATGEEAYSVAILLHEYKQRSGRRNPVRVFATDAHPASIEVAVARRYPREALAEVGPERLNRYFRPVGDEFEIVPELRSMLTFAPQNIVADAPFTRMDLVTCRNMLIYLRTSVQQQVLALLHFALNVGGVLFLGPSESVGPLREEFVTLDQHWRIYRKRRDRRLMADRLVPTRTPTLGLRERTNGLMPLVSPLTSKAPDNRLVRVYDLLLRDFVPAGFLISDSRELLHTFGRGRALLHPPEGRPTQDILDMVDPDLRVALGGAIQRVRRDGEPVRYTRVGVVHEGVRKRYTLSIRPIPDPEGEQAYLLVTLADEPLQVTNEASPGLAGVLGDGGGGDGVARRPTGQVGAVAGEGSGTDDLVGGDSDGKGVAPRGDAEDGEAFDERAARHQKIAALEQDLQYTRENLQATIEELETSNEELNATNEELIASNEELQSTNEELHSVNEELHTVNAEYQEKITELTRLTDDMNNLLASTEIGTVFLDRSLRVRRFTPQATAYFKLREQDLGRPIDDVAATVPVEGWRERLGAVIDNGDRWEGHVTGPRGETLLLRLSPYRAGDDRSEGVVITLVDISELEQAWMRREASEHRFTNAFENAPIGMSLTSPDGRFLRVNRRMCEMSGLSESEMLATNLQSITEPDDRAGEAAQLRSLLDGEREAYSVVKRLLVRDSTSLWVQVGVSLIRDADGEPAYLIRQVQNIDPIKRAQEELATLNRELEERVRDRTARLAESEARFFTAADNSPVMMWMTDASGQRTWANKGWRDFTGFRGDGGETPPDGEAGAGSGAGAAWLAMTHPEDRAELGLRWGSTLRNQAAWDAEYRLRHDPGDQTTAAATTADTEVTYRWVMDHAMPRFDTAGRFLGYMGTTIDITERKQAMETMRRSRDELEERVEARTHELAHNLQTLAQRNADLDQFAHAASHDLRSPLRTIIGFSDHLAELLEHTPTETGEPTRENLEDGRHYLDRIRAAALRMSQLIESLLAFSTVGRGEMQITSVDMDKLIRQVREDLVDEIEQRESELVVESTLPRVRGDTTMLRQLLQNLIGNAMKYRGERPPVVRVGVEEGDTHYRFHVKDNGVGFAPEHRERVFEPFQRLVSTGGRPGSGVGLSICRRVIERHGGRIWAESEPGRGSTFWFTLPRPDAANDSPAADFKVADRAIANAQAAPDTDPPQTD